MFRKISIGPKSFFQKSKPTDIKAVNRQLSKKQCQTASTIFGKEYVKGFCDHVIQSTPAMKQTSDGIESALRDMAKSIETIKNRLDELEKRDAIGEENDKNFQGTNWMTMQSRSKVYPTDKVKSSPNTHKPYSNYVDVTVKEFFDKK